MTMIDIPTRPPVRATVRALGFSRFVLALLALCLVGCSSSSSGSGSGSLGTPADADDPPQVTAHWTFDSISGGLVLDSGSGGFHGEVIGATSTDDGRVEGALLFDGSNQRVVVDADALELVRWDGLTIAVWVRPNSSSGSDVALVSYGTLPDPAFALIRDGSGAPKFVIAGKGEITSNPIPDDWVHLAATYDGARLTLYVNGNEITSLGGASGELPPALSDLGFGAESDGGNAFDGALDDLWLYSRALSADEVRSLFESTPPLPIIASDASTTTIRSQPVTIDLEIDGPDPEAIEADVVAAPLNGSVTFVASGPGAPFTAVYTPNPGYVGLDQFTFQGAVGSQLSNVATVTIDVTQPPARGRVQIVDNNVVADNGAPLRGETITIADWNLATLRNPHHWIELRDVFHVNTIRLLISRPPQYFSGGPGLDCFPPTYTCYALDYEVDGTSTALDLIDEAVDMARILGMYIVIDYHPVGGYDEADAVAWWSQVAPRYADSTHVLYELANEPVQWTPGDYTAEDVAFQENVFQVIRAGAPETHIILWTFGHLARGMKAKVDEGTAIDYSNASVGFHPYGAYDLSSAQELAVFYPAVQTEIGGTLGTGSYHETLVERTQDHENLGFSWFWLNGAKTTRGPGSTSDGIIPSEVTWDADAGVWTIDDTPPTAPTGLTGEALAWNFVELEWQAPSDPESGVVYYRVYRDGQLLGTPYQTKYFDGTALPTQNYTYEVTAVNGMLLESAAGVDFAVSTPSPPPNPTSVHWPFDSGFGSTAVDATGIGQNGTIVAPSWVDVAGEIALYFNGFDSYVAIPDGAVFMPIPGHGSLPGVDYSVTCTIQAFTAGPRQPIVAKQGAQLAGAQNGFLLELTELGHLRFQVSRDDGTGGTSSITSEEPLNIGTWYDIAATYEFLGDGVSKLRLYVEGVEVAASDSAVGPIQPNPQPLEVGREWWAPDESAYFEGVIDDVRVHNVRLTVEEVGAL